MGDHYLSGEEICKIIETCAKKGVSTLKCGPLEINFESVRKYLRTAPEPTKSVIPPENIIQDQKKAEEKALEAEEIQTREEQIAELMITNPAEAERLLENGDLQDSEESITDE